MIFWLSIILIAISICGILSGNLYWIWGLWIGASFLAREQDKMRSHPAKHNTL